MTYYDKEIPLEKLMGKTLTKIEIDEAKTEMRLFDSDGGEYLFYHAQDCCESVSIEDIAGDLDDLLNSPILEAEQSSSKENPDGQIKEWQDVSFTWTFYKLGTVNGRVTVRWYGSSNGYYGEDVDFCKLK